MRVFVRLSLGLMAVLVIGGCSMLPFVAPGSDSAVQVEDDDRFPDVIDVQLVSRGDGVYDVAVTISSPYDGPQRYADGWRVLDEAGDVLGTHTLLHDHAAEQPFTRTQRGLEVPEGVERVTVEGRDLVNGYGGGTFSIDVPA